MQLAFDKDYDLYVFAPLASNKTFSSNLIDSNGSESSGFIVQKSSLQNFIYFWPIPSWTDDK